MVHFVHFILSIDLCIPPFKYLTISVFPPWHFQMNRRLFLSFTHSPKIRTPQLVFLRHREMTNQCFESESENQSLSCVQLFAIPWTVVRHAPLSMECSRLNTGVGCHFLLQGIFPTRDWTKVSCIAGRFFTTWATREFQGTGKWLINCLHITKHILSLSIDWNPHYVSGTVVRTAIQRSWRQGLAQGGPDDIMGCPDKRWNQCKDNSGI